MYVCVYVRACEIFPNIHRDKVVSSVLYAHGHGLHYCVQCIHGIHIKYVVCTFNEHYLIIYICMSYLSTSHCLPLYFLVATSMK